MHTSFSFLVHLDTAEWFSYGEICDPPFTNSIAMHREALKRTLNAISAHEAEEPAYDDRGFVSYEPSREILDEIAHVRSLGRESQARDTLLHITLQAVGLNGCTDIRRLFKIDKNLLEEAKGASLIEQQTIHLRRKQVWLWANQLLQHKEVQQALNNLPLDTSPAARINTILQQGMAFCPLDLSELDHKSLEDAVMQYQATLNGPDASEQHQIHVKVRSI